MTQLRMNPAAVGVRRSAIREFMMLAARTPDCVSLTIGEPEFTTPAPIRESAKAALDAGRTHYIENNGDMALREAVSEFERVNSGLSYSPEEVIITVGATEGIFAALLSILEPGDEVIVPTPAFGLYEAVSGLCGGVFVPMDTRETGFAITKELLRGVITKRTKAIILNSPNNPTGFVYDEESLAAVREAVHGTGIFVISDEVYRRLVYREGYAGIAALADMRERTIVINAFSKPYAMTGWRAGYLMADSPVKQVIEKTHQYMVVSTASFIQSACAEALRQDIAPMAQAYRERRDLVYSRLLDLGLPTVKPEGAFYAFPSIKQFGMDSMEFCTRLVREAGLALTPGVCFGADDAVRISYCYTVPELNEGLDRLGRFIASL